MKLITKQFTPTGETLWLDYDPDSVLGKGPLVMPGSAKLPPFITAEVIEAGPLCKQVKKGDTVLCNSVVVTEVKLDREKYYFSTENKIIAIVKPAGPVLVGDGKPMGQVEN